MTGADRPSTAEPRRTPLYGAHKRAGAKLIDFGGWWMPVNYPSGIIDEHRATRGAVGLFDVCHMGEVHFRGSGAAAAVQRLVTNDIAKLVDGHALYTVACRPDGGIVDDLIVYRIAADHFLIVVNAGNAAKDVAWFRDNAFANDAARATCAIADESDATALVAFQGPKAEVALQPLTALPLASLRSFDFVAACEIAGVPASIARTGYTAEDGFEIFCDAARAEALWDRLVDAAAAVGGKPCGLGARDTLRLEGRLSLYGNDLSEETSPLEAGLGWVVKLDAGGPDFIGKPALLAEKARGVARKLVGFVMIGRGVARHGYALHAADDGRRVGEVTSGSYGPTVEKNIGMGYVPAALAEPGTRLAVDCRGKMVEAEVVRGPFYKRGKA